MNIQIYFYLENQGYTVFAQNEGNQLKRVGRINQYKNCYQFKDEVYKDWWDDRSLEGIMEEITKHYKIG